MALPSSVEQYWSKLRPQSRSQSQSRSQPQSRSQSQSRSQPQSRSQSQSPATISQSFYTRWARLYDTLARRAPGSGTVRSEAADALALSPGDTVVEMGCGTGANLSYLAERVGPEGTVVGIDFSPGVLAVARERVREYPNVRLVRADATRPPIQKHAPDAVLATFVSGMFSDPAAVVSSWADLVGPGGRLCLVDLAETTVSTWRTLNPVFRTLVRMTAPPGARTMRGSPTEMLNERLVAAHRALESRCRVTHRRTHVLGFARIRAGVVA
ncbi:alkanonic acid methyltransferase [Haloferax mediterranei ATCC 33500]|uniref:Alkanonic acid methyltransferase n=1 Tax=Haloferax mediterranei (strain ATCC 33500 / DSM 1411 / JCM 8866 / NBRC 14739 / NCIMB 2177 / R-4) TaxID=523841 RepID=I3R297_HALMT|nr:methyltransferase domain-containing protein [Haloferax mediterranei]AFK18357.2 alkanonic acid methyltransferase [Haloferax mediterranei ATCC 33500]